MRAIHRNQCESIQPAMENPNLGEIGTETLLLFFDNNKRVFGFLIVSGVAVGRGCSRWGRGSYYVSLGFRFTNNLLIKMG